MSNNNGNITILNFEGHKHTRRAGFHNPCGFVTDIEYTSDDGTDDRILVTTHLHAIRSRHNSRSDSTSKLQSKQKSLTSSLRELRRKNRPSDQTANRSLARKRWRQKTKTNQQPPEKRRQTNYSTDQIMNIMPTHVFDIHEKHQHRCKTRQEYDECPEHVIFGKWSTGSGWTCYRKSRGLLNIFLPIPLPNLESIRRQDRSSIKTMERNEAFSYEDSLNLPGHEELKRLADNLKPNQVKASQSRNKCIAIVM